MKKYFYNILISIDQLFNTLFNGNPDETISSRVGKIVRSWKNKKKWTIAFWLYCLLNWIQPEHCEKSIEEDEV